MGEVFLKLLNMSITAGWVIVAVMCVRLLFRNIPKWIHCALWGVAAIRLIVPFTFESTFSLQPIKINSIAEGEGVYYIPSVDSRLLIVEHTLNPMLEKTFIDQEVEGALSLQSFTEIAGVVWFCGMLLLLLFAIGSVVRLRLLVRESVCYKDNVYICDAVKSPFILGIIKPRIYLCSDTNESEMDYVIAHEAAHIRRKDYIWKPLGYLLLCVYWFQPLCWIAYIMLCKDIELACDEKVIKHMSFTDKKEYSKVLLSSATQRRLVMVCPLAFGEVGVKERVKTVLNYKKPAFWITMSAIIAGIIVSVCFLTNPLKRYEIRITIPAGSTSPFWYSDEEISPAKDTITLLVGQDVGDSEVLIKPIEVKEEIDYQRNYITPGMPCEMDVEKGGWYRIGLNMQNPTSEDMDVYVIVYDVEEVRIESSEGEDADAKVEELVAGDVAYYLELSAPDLVFEDMSESRKSEILAEYGNLLDCYTFVARESADGASVFIQPVDSAQNFSDTFLIYHNPAMGVAYIEDALRRGLVLNIPEEPYLSVYDISGTYGELTENIPLTEKETLEILSEANVKLPEGYGFAAALHINGETEYYFENSVPQSVVNLAVEKCIYQFATPKSSISAPISKASLVCNWLEEPIILDTGYLAQLEEILKSAKFTGVGNCGYGATLILTLENGECMTVLKGTDDCGSLVFGSYGGYSISDEADDAFWEMFGLPASAEKRLGLKSK